MLVREMPRLRAAESLETATAVWVGTGSGKRETIRRTVAGWERRMRQGEPVRKLELSREQVDTLMRAKGISVEWQSRSDKRS